jgi:hydroxymethylbilane synthase
VPPGGAVVVAVAALDRLGLAARAAEVLDVVTMLPQVGQGAIALRCRAADGATRQLLALVDDEVAHACVLAERAFLASVGGGCDAPVGAYARRCGHGAELELDALVARPDGGVVVRRRGVGDEPEALGREVGRSILAAGGAELLALAPE